MANKININIVAEDKASAPIAKTSRSVKRLGKDVEEAGKGAGKDWAGLTDLFTGFLPRGLQSTIRSFKMAQRQIGRLSSSFKFLKGAIASTGFGILIVLLGEIIANWETITEYFRDKTREEQLERENKQLERNLRLLNDTVALARAQGATQIELQKLKIEQLKAEERLLEHEAKRLAYSYDEEAVLKNQEALRQKRLDLTIAQIEKENTLASVVDKGKRYIDDTYRLEQERLELVAQEEESLAEVNALLEKNAYTIQEAEAALPDIPQEAVRAELQKQINTANEENNTLLVQQAELQEIINKKLELFDEKQKAARRAQAKQRKEQLADQREQLQQALEIAKIEGDEEKELKKRQFQYEAEQQRLKDLKATTEDLLLLEELYEIDRTAIAKKYQEQRDKLYEQSAQKESDARSKLEDELYLLTQKGFDREETLLMQQYETRVAIAGDDEGLRLKAEEQYLKDRDALVDKYAQEEKDKLKKEEEEKLAIKEFYARSGFDLLSNLNQLFTKESQKDSKKAFQRNKALAISETLISTYFGAQKAYASQINPADPTSPIRATIAAAVAVTAGLAKVKAIKEQEYNSPKEAGRAGGSSPQRSGFGIPLSQLPTPARNKSDNQMRAYVVQTDLQGSSYNARKMQMQTTL